jgi:hypothetical protein
LDNVTTNSLYENDGSIKSVDALLQPTASAYELAGSGELKIGVAKYL